MKPFEPMLSAKTDDRKIQEHLDQGGFLLASAKLDGIRAVKPWRDYKTPETRLLSRSLKPIPNTFAQQLFEFCTFTDGELIAGPPNAGDVYNRTFRAVMSESAQDDLTYWVFDHLQEPDLPYVERMKGIAPHESVKVLPQKMITNYADAVAFEAEMLDMNFEGAMFRKPNAPYKFGRSTARELYLMKVKRDTEETAEILEVLERMHNGNEAFISELGRTKRSSHQDNKEGLNTAGAWRVRWNGMEFKCALGQFSAAEAQDIWNRREQIVRENLLDFRFFGYGNVKDGQPGAPRHPRGLRLRSKLDMS